MMLAFQQLLKSDLSSKKKAFLQARKEYYNQGNTSLTDAEFDKLEANIQKLDPTWKHLKSTGTSPILGKKVAVKLTVSCPSLDKLVADKPAGLSRWIGNLIESHGPAVFISEKLDGSSVEATYTKGKLTQLATRGNGTLGKSIMFLATSLNIPVIINTNREVLVIRFEAIIKTAVYEKKWAGSYDSARALSSAVLNRHDASPVLKDLDFIALRVLKPELSIHLGLQELRTLGFQTVRGKFIKDISAVPLEQYPEMLTSLRSTSKYECDGMVICSANSHLETTAEKPDYAKAYKMNDEANGQVTTIQEIVWKSSAFGVLVPKAKIAPVKFGGVTVTQAALHNAKWGINKKAGVGATVVVIRSGDIIPKIIEVKKPKPFALPDPAVVGKYKWDKTQTAIVLLNADKNDSVRVRKIARLFAVLGLDNLAGGLAKKLVTAGYSTTKQVVEMRTEDFAKLPGVHSMAAKFSAQMERLTSGEMSLPHLMVASGCFERGVGKTRIISLQSAHPEALLPKNSQAPWLFDKIAKTPGCGPAFAKSFCLGIVPFWEWATLSGIKWKKPQPQSKPVSGPLSGQAFTWTRYRNKDEELEIQALGGEVVSFGSKTSVLFYRDNGKVSSKLEKAQAKGITVTTFQSFMKKGKYAK